MGNIQTETMCSYFDSNQLSSNNFETNLQSLDNFQREGISKQDLKHIQQAFENMREFNDPPNEVQFSKLKHFPFFNKDDLEKIKSEIAMYNRGIVRNGNELVNLDQPERNFANAKYPE